MRYLYSKSFGRISRSCNSSTNDCPRPTVAAPPPPKLKGAPVVASTLSTVYLSSQAITATSSKRCGLAARAHQTLPVDLVGKVLRGTVNVGVNASSDDSATTKLTSARALPSPDIDDIAELVIFAWMIRYRGKKCLVISTSGKLEDVAWTERALKGLALRIKSPNPRALSAGTEIRLDCDSI